MEERTGECIVVQLYLTRHIHRIGEMKDSSVSTVFQKNLSQALEMGLKGMGCVVFYTLGGRQGLTSQSTFTFKQESKHCES